jgi:hypothetical protein
MALIFYNIKKFPQHFHNLLHLKGKVENPWDKHLITFQYQFLPKRKRHKANATYILFNLQNKKKTSASLFLWGHFKYSWFSVTYISINGHKI